MIEVFKTNVENCDQAMMLLANIHENFAGYKANFDLQDCDKILRVQSVAGVESNGLINFLKNLGFHAEVLTDEFQTVAHGFAGR